MKFEWDEAKNRANVRKHGLDFAEAGTAFDGPIVVHADVREDCGEQRRIGVGNLKGQTVVIVFVERAPDTLRIISMRKAKKHERVAYEAEISNRLGSP